MGISMSMNSYQPSSKIGSARRLKPPFSYFNGRILGISCPRNRSWDEIMDKLAARLSKWKMKTLSIRAKVIKGIHGEDDIARHTVNNYHPSIWLDIVREVKKLKSLCIDPTISYSTKIWDNGFCHGKNHLVVSRDSWSSFRRVVRGGVEQAQLSQLITNLEGVTLGDMRDRWVWSMDGTCEFSVASVRRMIDDRLLPDISSKTKWVNMVPIKINIQCMES
ncbi:hypothetical protein Tco_0418330 [Tanacetum coccineum]